MYVNWKDVNLLFLFNDNAIKYLNLKNPVNVLHVFLLLLLVTNFFII